MSRQGWWIPEAQQFESALDNALRAEEADGADAGGEPESEHPGEAEISGACLQSLHDSVTQHVVTPLINAEPTSPEAQQALELFPGVIEELIMLLQKTSRLAYLRGHVRQELTSRLSTAEASLTQSQRVEVVRAVSGSLDEDEQEGSVATRLIAARKTVKQKDWELADARRRIQQVEEERVRQDKRLRDLELALASANTARQDAERRCAESTDEGTAFHRSELRRRILETEKALDEARVELGEAERRADGARGLESARVPQDSTAQVPALSRRETPEEADDRCDVESLRSQRTARSRKSMPSQLQELDVGCAEEARYAGGAIGPQDPLADAASPTRREAFPEEADDKFDVESLRSQRTARSRKSMPMQRGAAVTSTESSPEQVGHALSRTRRRTMGYSSAPALPQSSAAPAAQPAAMPGDLRSLGALLAGGGLFSAGK